MAANSDCHSQWGKHRRKFDDTLAERNGCNVPDGMMTLLGVMGGMDSWHYMSLDILGYLFMSVAKQDRPMGKPYRDPKHMSAERWKAALDTFKDEAVDRLYKHMDSQVFVYSQVLPGCLQDSKYFEFTFPMDPPLANEPILALPVLGSVAIWNSIPWPNLAGGSSSPVGAMAMSVGNTPSSGMATPLTTSATGTPTKQGELESKRRRNHTQEEIEEENFMLMLAQDMEDVEENTSTPKEGSPTDEGSTTDAEITGAMSQWTLQSPMDMCQVVDDNIAWNLVPKPDALPNLQQHAKKQRELDQL